MRLSGLGGGGEDGAFSHAIDLYQSGLDPDRTSARLLVAEASEEAHSPAAAPRDGEGDGAYTVVATAADVRVLFPAGQVEVRAPVVYAGYGITAPEHDWDDYRDLDVRGRIVLVLRYEPAGDGERSRFAGSELSEHALFLTKANNAAGRGAVGMIVVTGPEHHTGAEDLRTTGTLRLDPAVADRAPPSSRLSGFASIQMAQDAIGAALGALGLDLRELQERTDAGAPAASVDLDGLIAEISIGSVLQAAPIPARNLVGVLPATAGLQPASEAGWIVIAAHHDHLGSFGAGRELVYPGADDNASGVAVLLEVGAHLAGRPRGRNLAFVAFTAEEQGFLGSRAFIRDAIVPTDQIALMVNLDMLGRNPAKPVRVTVSDGTDDYATALETTAGELGLSVALHRGPAEPVSDHYPFQQSGVPIVSFFTGLHDDYHEVTDTADRLDYERMALIARLVAELIEAAGN